MKRQPQSVTNINLGSVSYCYIDIFPSPLSAPPAAVLTSKGESISYPFHQHRMLRLFVGSSAHLGLPHIFTSILILLFLSMGSSDLLSVVYLWCYCPVSFHNSSFSSPFQSLLLPCLPDSSRLYSRDSAEISFSKSLRWASAAVCCHHGSSLRLPPSYLFSSRALVPIMKVIC